MQLRRELFWGYVQMIFHNPMACDVSQLLDTARCDQNCGQARSKSHPELGTNVGPKVCQVNDSQVRSQKLVGNFLAPFNLAASLLFFAVKNHSICPITLNGRMDKAFKDSLPTAFAWDRGSRRKRKRNEAEFFVSHDSVAKIRPRLIRERQRVVLAGDTPRPQLHTIPLDDFH